MPPLPPVLTVLGRGPASLVQLVARPELTGTPAVGATLALSDGVWNGATTFEKRYLRDGALIPGAAGDSYPVVAADDHRVLTGEVRARGAQGGWSGWAASLPLTIGALAAGVLYGADRVLSGTDIVIHSE